MSAITTHVLDTARGRPAAGIAVTLERAEDDGWRPLGESVTDADGRCRDLLPEGARPEPGAYRLTFATGEYHARHGTAGFYPRVMIEFLLADPQQHFHVPLLLSPYGYSTYRGS